MLNPSVGEILEISSPTKRLRMVVFPALSSPLLYQRTNPLNETAESTLDIGEDMQIVVQRTYRKRTLISFDFALFFRMIVKRPMICQSLHI